ncbi:MAG: hypothetical protein Q9195_002309 [Heterodermia aff. obscurata]
MEPVSLAVGLVPIFVSAIDILDRVRDYKEFGDESEAILSRFEASRLKLHSWAKALGIGDGMLSDAHDPRLDDPRTASVVQNILLASIRVFDKVDYQSESLRLPLRQRSAGIDGWSLPADDIRRVHPERESMSKRSRLAWATGGKTRFEKDVRNFESLVNVLNDVVPPRGLEEESLAKMHLLEEKLDILADLDVGIEKLLALATAQKQHNVESWLDAIDDEDQYRTLINLRLNGTYSSNGAAIVLWINGPAGFGKSVLSAALVHHIRATLGHSLAFCFSSSHAQSVHEMDGIVRTWTTQLIRQNKTSLDLAFQMHQTRKTRRASRDDLWTILKDITTQIHGCVLSIDGLDEFRNDDDRRGQFLSDLKNALQGTNARILITSRTEFDIESGLRLSAKEPQVYSLLDCKISRHHLKDDIDLVSKNIVARKLPKHEQYLREELAVQMAERCDGQFLWLKFQQDLLRDSKSPKALRAVVQAMPQKLHAIYERSWSHMLALEEPDRSRAIDTLRWLTFAYRPLSVQELAEALVVSLDKNQPAFSEEDLPGNIDAEYIDGEIKNLCGSLIELREDTENPDPRFTTVRLVHASVHDFLVEKLPLPALAGSIPGDSCLSAAQHVQLAACCIRFLDCAEAWDFSSQTPQSFTKYAVESWFRHLKDSRDHFEPITELINHFIRRGNPNFDKARVMYEQRSESSARKPGTSLYYACLFGLLPAMDFLRNSEDQLDLNVRGGEYCTPLQAVCLAGHMEAFDRLMQWGADVTVRGGRFGNAFNAAAYHNRMDMMKVLVSHRSPTRTLSTEMHGAITTAAFKGHVDIVEFLLNQGANIDCSHSYSLYLGTGSEPIVAWQVASPLLAATATSHLSVVKILVERGADVNVQDKDGDTALRNAIFRGSPEIVELLLEYNANPNIGGSYGGALHLAAKKGHLNIATQLIDKEAILELGDLFESTPLHLAARYGHLKVVEYLCARGANMNTQSSDGSTPLYQAAWQGHTDTAAYLIGEGVDVNIRNKDGEVALHTAIEGGHSGVASALIRAGATLHAINQGFTPLHLAARNGISALVVPLIEAGADRDAQDHDGITPLHEAVINGHPRVVGLLLKSGAVIKADNRGWKPLHDAANLGSLEVIKQLLEGGADLHARNNTGWTPLHVAAQKNDPNIIAFFLDQGSNISAQTDNGYTALMVAVLHQNSGVIELLISRRADVNVADWMGFAPLHRAVQQKNMEFVQILVQGGCDVSVTSLEGASPLRMAIERGNDEISQFLVQSGADLDLTDCYGMRVSDWLHRSRPNLKTSQLVCEVVQDNPSGPDQVVLRRTIFQLATQLKNAGLVGQTHSLYILAHCFIFLGLEDEAVIANQQVHLLPNVTADNFSYCDGCSTIQDKCDEWFTCKICPDTDCCGRCMRDYHEKNGLKNGCLDHEFIQIFGPNAKLGPNDIDTLDDWLDRILQQFKDA